MSFEKSVIIPLDLYRKCRLDKADRSLDLLFNESMPSDKKLKLYNQARLVHKQSSGSSIKAKDVKKSTPDLALDHILHNIPDKDKPYAKSILDIFISNSSILDWTDNNEVIVDGQVIAGSNLINILLYLTRNLPVTSSTDVPLGSREVYDKLLSLGMPESWVKKKPSIPRRPRAVSAAVVPTRQRKKKRKRLESDVLTTWS